MDYPISRTADLLVSPCNTARSGRIEPNAKHETCGIAQGDGCAGLIASPAGQAPFDAADISGGAGHIAAGFGLAGGRR